jgi:hypothetical protein
MAIQEVGARRLCEDVDLIVMSSLVEMGIMTVRDKDRRLILTEIGWRAYQKLQSPGSRWSAGSWQ